MVPAGGSRDAGSTEKAALEPFLELIDLASDADLSASGALARGTALIATAIGADAAVARLERPGSDTSRVASRWGRRVEDEGPFDLTVPIRAGGLGLGELAFRFASEPLPGAAARAQAGAGVLGMLLRNAQLATGLADRARELERQTRRLAVLNQISRTITPGATEQELAAALAERIAEAFGARGVAVIAAPGEELARYGRLPEQIGGEAGEAIRSRGVVSAPLWPGAPPGAAGRLVLDVGDGRVDATEREWLGAIAAQAGALIANARLFSALRQERDERREIGRVLGNAQDDERRRLAEDLHYGPVQELVCLGLSLDALTAHLSSSGRAEAAERSGESAAAAREVITALRGAIFDLHPIGVEELGTRGAARALTSRLASAGVTATIDLDGLDALTGGPRTAAFRVLQEAVANVIRHSRATRAEIVAAALPGGGAELRIEDDGQGFLPGAATERAASGHVGLTVMRERVDRLGGTLEIGSDPGAGTRIRVTFPGE
jgi:signal transduction histidine kinase